MHKKICLFILLLSLTINTFPIGMTQFATTADIIYKSIKTYLKNSSTTQRFALAGMGAFTLVGIANFIAWARSKPNEELIKQTTQILKNTQQSIDPMISFFEGSGIEIPFSETEQQKNIQEAKEGFLHQLFQFIALKHDSSQHAFITETLSAFLTVETQPTRTLLARYETDLQVLQSHHTLLEQRMNALVASKKNLNINSYHGMIFNQMNTNNNKILELISKISFIKSFVATHAPFWTLVKAQDFMTRHYYQELATLSTSKDNSTLIKEALDILIMRQAVQSHTAYPYKEYIEKLAHDSQTLQKAIEAMRYSFETVGAARSLLANLQTIEDILIVQEVYHQELQAYEKVTLEKKRIEAKQAKAHAAYIAAHAAQTHADAAQRQAWYTAEQNRIQARQLKETQRQHDLLVQNSSRPAATAVHVHVA